MVESLGFLLDVLAKDLYAIPASIEPQRIHDLSIHKDGIRAESRGNVEVDFFCVGA